MDVQAQVAAYPDRHFTGKVTAMNPSVDPNSRAFIVEAKFPNPDLTSAARHVRDGSHLLCRRENAGNLRSLERCDHATPTTNSSQVFLIRRRQGPSARWCRLGEREGDQVRDPLRHPAASLVATDHWQRTVRRRAREDGRSTDDRSLSHA